MDGMVVAWWSLVKVRCLKLTIMVALAKLISWFGPYNSFFLVSLQAVQEEISIADSFMKLRYLSTRVVGYKSLLRVILSQTSIPLGLSKIHISAVIEGRKYQRWYPAAPGLVYVLSWNKTDIYDQEVFGLTEASGKHSSLHSMFAQKSLLIPNACLQSDPSVWFEENWCQSLELYLISSYSLLI